MKRNFARRFRTFAGFIAVITTSIGHAAEIDFEADILPIFEEHCLHCHGEDEQESGLRLDRRGGMLRGGDSGLAALVPGKPLKSYLLEVVNHVDEDMAMPPDEDKIPAEQIDLLTRWITAGAVWPGQMEEAEEQETDHWAFLPTADSFQHDSIDGFLQARLKESELDFSEPADPRSLIRRASIVLTGLTPTPEQTAKFVTAHANAPESSYESLIDELLASPQFGERWAQHWLDVIRWAETNGSEANLYRKNAWIYRDYVVRAFNEDKPYDQFVAEQIAGDSLGAGEATGFLVAGPHVPAATVGRELSAIRQARADRMDEIMQTVGASVMGVTVGCARCHNHKFDPISIQDYYSMTAVFQDVEFGSRSPELADDHPRRQRGKEIWKQIAASRQQLRKLGGWEENWGAFRELHFNPVTTTAIRVRFKTPNVGLDELEVLGPVGQSDNFALRQFRTKVSGFPEKGFQGRFPIGRVADGEYGTMTWNARVPAKEKERPWVQFDFESPKNIARLRLSNNREYFYETDYLTQKPNLPRYEFDVDVMQDDGTWKPWVGTWAVNKKLSVEYPERDAMLAEIQRSINLLAEEGPRPSFVGRFIEPEVTRVLLRGSPESPRDEVPPAGPTVFEGDLGLDSETPGPKRRLAFANWITSPENPLTARVMVNRMWHHAFGTGIVPTTSDFGRAGALPTHPELLDWLANEFSRPAKSADGSEARAWSIKRMIRMMVMSKAFRQSSQPHDRGLQVDSGSSLLWRFPPKRVEAEVIRDSVLQASGTLDRSVGGRSYRIHDVKKTYAQWQVVNNYGPQTWRRMLYQERMRRVDDRIFTAFDFPDCGQVRAKRPISTTPLQALNLMNSDFVLDQSQRIATRALKDASGSRDQAIHACFQRLLSRNAAPPELEACREMMEQHDLALVCRALINSNEFAFLP